MLVLPCGEHALLLQLAHVAEVVELTNSLRAAMPPGVLSCVPASTSILLTLDPAADREAVIAELREIPNTGRVTLGTAKHGAGMPQQSRRALRAPRITPTNALTIDPEHSELDAAAVAAGTNPADLLGWLTNEAWRLHNSSPVGSLVTLITTNSPTVERRSMALERQCPAGTVLLCDGFLAICVRETTTAWFAVGAVDIAQLDDLTMDEPIRLQLGSITQTPRRRRQRGTTVETVHDVTAAEPLDIEVEPQRLPTMIGTKPAEGIAANPTMQAFQDLWDQSPIGNH